MQEIHCSGCGAILDTTNGTRLVKFLAYEDKIQIYGNSENDNRPIYGFFPTVDVNRERILLMLTVCSKPCLFTAIAKHREDLDRKRCEQAIKVN